MMIKLTLDGSDVWHFYYSVTYLWSLMLI